MNMNGMKNLFELKMSNDTFIQMVKWLLLPFFLLRVCALPMKKKTIALYCCCSLPGKTYLISDYLMGSLVCDILRQVLHNDKLFERPSLHVIRIHCCSRINSGSNSDSGGRINRVAAFVALFVILIILKVFTFIYHTAESRLKGEH